jgi:phosphatidylglycerol:prolipoprotein diacylglycerol transferase
MVFLLGQSIGRWGNSMNREAFDATTDSFFRMGLFNMKTIAWEFYHPTFLYESLWNILGFVLITLLYRKKKFNGQVTLMYIAWYGFGRMFIEGLRTDSLYVGPFRISQLIGMLCFVAGTALMIVGFVMQHKGKLPDWMQVSFVQAEAVSVAETSAQEHAAEAVTEACTCDSENCDETQANTEEK